jgi:hypothetical protein
VRQFHGGDAICLLLVPLSICVDDGAVLDEEARQVEPVFIHMG